VAVLAVPLALTIGRGGAALKAMPPSAIALYAASGLASLLLAQYAYYKLLAQADVSKVFPLLFAAAPIVTIAIGVFVLKEPMTLKQALGAALVVAGGLLLL
jgi:drug/metabolite transporter (DMT)-like permease